MAMTKWAPFSAFTELEQEMQTLLDRFGGRPWLEGFGWKPDTDVSRDGATLVVEADLPGVDPEHDLQIDVLNNVLRIEGEKCASADISEADRLVQERRCGCFRRSVLLPDGIDAESIAATFENGTLTVRIPLPEASVTEGEMHRVHIDVGTR
jgi:HSP20 family protein